MAKCPKCKKTIDRLNCYSEALQYFTIEEDGQVDYSSVEEIGDTLSFNCPECGQEVAQSEEVAREILKDA